MLQRVIAFDCTHFLLYYWARCSALHKIAAENFPFSCSSFGLGKWTRSLIPHHNNRTSYTSFHKSMTVHVKSHEIEDKSATLLAHTHTDNHNREIGKRRYSDLPFPKLYNRNQSQLLYEFESRIFTLRHNGSAQREKWIKTVRNDFKLSQNVEHKLWSGDSEWWEGGSRFRRSFLSQFHFSFCVCVSAVIVGLGQMTECGLWYVEWLDLLVYTFALLWHSLFSSPPPNVRNACAIFTMLSNILSLSLSLSPSLWLCRSCLFLKITCNVRELAFSI